MRLKSAHEIARETEKERVGGTTVARSVANVKRAREARERFKEWQRKSGALLPSYDDEDELVRASKAKGGGAGLDASMLASLQAEFADADGEDTEQGGEEGGGGEDEGAYDDDADVGLGA